METLVLFVLRTLKQSYKWWLSYHFNNKGSLHYHLQVEPNPPKNCTIKPMLFSVSMGKTGLTHDIFFEFSLRPFEVVEVEWKLRLIFWGCNFQLLQSFRHESRPWRALNFDPNRHSRHSKINNLHFDLYDHRPKVANTRGHTYPLQKCLIAF